jgi:hypothetical protein
MSLSCRECRESGAFNWLVLYSESGFEMSAHLASYANFYIHEYHLSDLPEKFTDIGDSKYLVVREPETQSYYLTGVEGCILSEVDIYPVDVSWMARNLPNCLNHF